MRRTFLIVTLLVGLNICALPADAQPIATIRWQLRPYCNIVSLAVTPSGGVFRLDGTDDQCGAATKASTGGVAFFNPDGSIGLGFTIVGSPGGAPVHVDATIALSTLNGTWRDSAGNSGTFIATPGAGVAGPPRPLGGGTTHELVVHAFGALTLNGVPAETGIGGCMVFAAGGSGLQLGLSLPRGAVITQVLVNLVDASTQAIQVALARDDFPDGGPPARVEASQLQLSPDGTHNSVPLVLLPAVVTPVSRTRSYHIDAAAPAHTGVLSFCGATVRYTIDPTATADRVEIVQQ